MRSSVQLRRICERVARQVNAPSRYYGPDVSGPGQIPCTLRLEWTIDVDSIGNIMRVAGLSVTSVSTLRHRFGRVRDTRLRLLHSSTRMQQNPGNVREMPAEWLRRIIEDDTKPPKLYAWTPQNLSVGGGAEFESVKGARTGSGTYGRGDDERRRIFVLGIGNIGILYAICLSRIANNPPPITLVVHRRELLERWVAEPGIELIRHGRAHRNAKFDIEWWTDTAPGRGHNTEVAAGRSISNLIVATKASIALPQIDRIRRYLDSNSTVAFAQNGMCKLWPPVGDTYVRARFPDGTNPNWIACVTTHGVTSQGPFRSIHAAPANALVGPVMSNGVDRTDEQIGYLMRQIASAPDLDARVVPRKELWIAQLEKLVVNAIINPLTAVLRCKNGEIFVPRDDGLPAVIDKLLTEASKMLNTLIRDPASDGILNSDSLNQEATSDEVFESQGASREQLLERFSFPRLRTMVLEVGAKVSANTSSMLQDVRAGKPTEIDDFNGWLIDMAKLLDKGLQLPTHEKLIALVKGQAVLTRGELCAKLLAENHS
ncbi:ketoisovalerate reductase [Xylaria cubensis]|nr:ketoisovalerate reductase [Xylaria cubensis]